MTPTPNRFSFLIELACALVACGTPEETPASPELGGPFAAIGSDR